MMLKIIYKYTVMHSVCFIFFLGGGPTITYALPLFYFIGLPPTVSNHFCRLAGTAHLLPAMFRLMHRSHLENHQGSMIILPLTQIPKFTELGEKF